MKHTFRSSYRSMSQWKRKVLPVGLLLLSFAATAWFLNRNIVPIDAISITQSSDTYVAKPIDAARAPMAAAPSTAIVKTQTVKTVQPSTVTDSQLAQAAQMNAPSRSIRGSKLYIDPASSQSGRSGQIASQPVATWLGEWSDVQTMANIKVTQAAAQNSLAVLVACNIPSRDCGSYSAGGASSSTGYRQWIDRLAAGIGQRQAVVILEPDALASLDCLKASDQTQRLSDISYAVTALVTRTNASIYIDAGNYSWQSVSTMTTRLKQANILQAQGISLNVSGYGWTANSITYGMQLIGALGKKMVIDTSRNGNGPAPNNEWCNPRGRSLGERPTTNASAASVDGYLWVKVPGESDGTCNGGPNAGEWWADYANELIENAGL